VKKRIILQRTLSRTRSFVNLERVEPGEKGRRLLAATRERGDFSGGFFREAFSGLVHKLDPISRHYSEKEREREKGSLKTEETHARCPVTRCR